MALTTSASASPVATVVNVHEVDDAGGVHYETTMTGEYIVDLVDRGILKLEGNIRPDHMPGRVMGAKTRRKIKAWAEELARNDAVIGNISVRLDPTTSEYALEEDDEGQVDLHINNGYLDTAVDSLSRIKAILMASKSPARTFNLKTRFAVRIWIAQDPLAKRVAAIYNTRGDKVNDTAAKFAHQSTAPERMAKKLMVGSGHLTIDNVEVFTNTVSASSPKLLAFNTLVQAIAGSWQDEPMGETDEDAQAEFLVGFWNALVKVRPEFGRLSLKDRRDLRGSSLAGTALSVHGVMAVADSLWQGHLDPAASLSGLKDTVVVGGRRVDYLSYENPLWGQIGLLVPATDTAGVTRLTLRMSFQTRDAIGKEFKAKLGLPN
jgi:hypothetical protein